LNLDQRLDQRTYNAPITSEVADVWVEGNERIKKFDKSVVLHGNNNEIQRIKSYYGCYDPLSYPLFFPRGELGWHSKMPKENIKNADVRRGHEEDSHAEDNNDDDDPGKLFNIFLYLKLILYIRYTTTHATNFYVSMLGTDAPSSLWVTMKEYYCYKLHTRPNIFNPILYGRRLLQQFVVDTYIKIESSRLDYIFHHQKELRADLY
jgi:hypothetical protein